MNVGRDFKVIDGLPVCQTPRAFEACCDDCAGLGNDGDGTPLCMGEVRDDRARLVEIARVVYGPDYSEAYDSERSLAGLAQAVAAGWGEKERLRGVVERICGHTCLNCGTQPCTDPDDIRACEDWTMGHGGSDD